MHRRGGRNSGERPGAVLCGDRRLDAVAAVAPRRPRARRATGPPRPAAPSRSPSSNTCRVGGLARRRRWGEGRRCAAPPGHRPDRPGAVGSTVGDASAPGRTVPLPTPVTLREAGRRGNGPRHALEIGQSRRKTELSGSEGSRTSRRKARVSAGGTHGLGAPGAGFPPWESSSSRSLRPVTADGRRRRRAGKPTCRPRKVHRRAMIQGGSVHEQRATSRVTGGWPRGRPRYRTARSWETERPQERGRWESRTASRGRSTSTTASLAAALRRRECEHHRTLATLRERSGDL